MATQTENLTEPEHNDNWRIIIDIFGTRYSNQSVI